MIPTASDPVHLLCQALSQALYEDYLIGSSLDLEEGAVIISLFADEETEAQRRGGAGPGSHSQ